MDIEPFKLLRDGNWVLNLAILTVMIPAAFIEPGSLSIGFIMIPLSAYMLYNSLFGPGDYGMIDGRLAGRPFMERVKIGLIWE